MGNIGQLLKVLLEWLSSLNWGTVTHGAAAAVGYKAGENAGRKDVTDAVNTAAKDQKIKEYEIHEQVSKDNAGLSSDAALSKLQQRNAKRAAAGRSGK